MVIGQILNRVFRSTALRLIVAGCLVSIPVCISNAYVGAAYLYYVWGDDFWGTVFGLTFYANVAVLGLGFMLLYPLERWVIRDRAAHSRQWVAIRILLYLLVSMLLGVTALFSIRWGMRQYPAIVESSYFVIAILNVSVVSILYSLFERVLVEVRRREARLQGQIEQLQIQLDEINRDRQVREITESEYFRQLLAKARQLRVRPAT
jgi:hypothetical protein